MKKDFFILFIFIICIGSLLSACGVQKEKTEEYILSDLQTQDTAYSDYGLTIDSISITKRRTNQDSKTDYVWCEVVASNDNFIYYADYEITNVLYNDGWLLENCERTSRSIEPKSYPTPDDATDAMQATYETFEYLSEQRGDNNVDFYFQREETYHYLTTNYITTVSFVFSPETLWTYSINETKDSYSLDIEGEWVYQDSERYFYINIISVGEDLNEEGDFNVTLDYYLENIHTSSNHTTTKASNGPVDMVIDTYDSSRNRWSITLDRYSAFGNISMYLGVEDYELTESTGYGIACDGYFLIKNNTLDAVSSQ